MEQLVNLKNVPMRDYHSHLRPRGQSMMELLVAIGVLMLGTSTALMLGITSVTAGTSTTQRLIAMNLAQEGIEVIRSQRDGNAMARNAGEIIGWDANFSPTQTPTTAIVDFNGSAWSVEFQYTLIEDCRADATCQLFQDAVDDYYTHEPTGNTATPFYRLVTLLPICFIRPPSPPPTFTIESDLTCDGGGERVGYRVRSEVQWQDRGQWKSEFVVDDLYHWNAREQ
jgi:hypothetical protein